MSLSSFAGGRASPPENLSLSRFTDTGVPFLGDPRLYRKDEYEHRAMLDYSFDAAFFCLFEPTHMERYRKIWVGALHGFHRIIHSDRCIRINGVPFHYLEWAVKYHRDKFKPLNGR